MRLRPYKPSDARHISKWILDEITHAKWCANHLDFPVTERVLNELKISFDKDDKGMLFTALNEEGVPMGFLAMSKVDYEKKSVHFGYVIVDDTIRNKGVGKEMLGLAVKYAFEILDVDKITLKVFDNNPIAHFCYLKMGFCDTNYDQRAFHFKEDIWGCYDMEICKKS